MVKDQNQKSIIQHPMYQYLDTKKESTGKIGFRLYDF